MQQTFKRRDGMKVGAHQVQVLVRMDKGLWARVKKEGAVQRRSVSTLVEEAVGVAAEWWDQREQVAESRRVAGAALEGRRYEKGEILTIGAGGGMTVVPVVIEGEEEASSDVPEPEAVEPGCVTETLPAEPLSRLADGSRSMLAPGMSTPRRTGRLTGIEEADQTTVDPAVLPSEEELF